MFSKILAAVMSFFSFSFLKPATPPAAPVPTVIVSPTPAANITITSPAPGTQIGYILEIRGQARVFENQFQWRLKDSAGKVLVSGTSMTDAPDSGLYGNYLISTAYPIPSLSNGLVEVYDSSAKDGTEIDLVSVPVKFASGPVSEFNIYLGRYSEKSTMEPCQTVVPVKRYVPKTLSVARAAVEQLLQGPTTAEKQALYTSINSGVTINSLTIKNGLAKVDFSDALEKNVGGSCRVAHIRTQITQTLKQFSSVKQVVISINGRVDDILQP